MADHGTDIDIAGLARKDVRVIDEGDRLRFAKQVLLFVGVVCGQALASIFELIKIGLLPLITLDR